MGKELIDQFYAYVDGRRKQPPALPRHDISMVRAALEAKFAPRLFTYEEVQRLLKEEKIPAKAPQNALDASAPRPA